MGKIFAVTMVKNEADVISFNIEHLIQQGVHKIIIADNQSTDGTLGILQVLKKKYPDQVELRMDNEPAYYQSQKMTMLAKLARDQGANWVIPFDADEWWQPVSGQSTIAELLEMVLEDYLTVPIINHYPTDLDLVDVINPFKRMCWRKPGELGMGKIALRCDKADFRIEQGNHSVTFFNYVPRGTSKKHKLEIRHFPYRSREQFLQKAIQGGKAYELTNLPQSVGQHWRGYYDAYKRGGKEAVYSIFDNWFYYVHPQDKELSYEPVKG